MRAFRPAVTTGGVLLLVVLGVTPVLACDFPPPPPPAEAAQEADAVFVGTVTAIEPAGDVDVVTIFEVARVWRGPPTPSTQVATPENPGMCGYPFEVDRSYLVYANERDGELQTSIATRTMDLETADEDLRALGEGAPPDSDGGYDVRLLALAVVALALITAIGLGWHFRRSGSPGRHRRWRAQDEDGDRP